MEKTEETGQTSASPAGPMVPAVRGPTKRFWKRVQNAERRLLMLDYDGTLAPFHVSRMDARPSDDTLKIVREIMDSGHTRVVVVSGRSAREVRELLRGLNVETFGAHGFERSPEIGTVSRQELSSDEIEGLEAARTAAENAGMGKHVEMKPASIAVHTRGLDPVRAMEIEELAYNVLTPVAEKYGLQCRAFNGGVEVRSRRFHKGLAVTSLLKEYRGREILAVYVGDDDTDEDAFRTLLGRGIGIRVGTRTNETAAEIQLAKQEDVHPFLQEWHRVAASRPTAPVPTTETSRLVVVSNRLPTLETDAQGHRARPVGGLATAVESALERSQGGGLWMGWSGHVSDRGEGQRMQEQRGDNVNLVGIDLTKREYEAYYNGFSNKTIWPLFHSFPTFASMSEWQLEVYRSVNAMFAHTLVAALQPGDTVWIHDYHLMFVGRELRRAGWRGKLGFFLHIPFPALDILAILPDFTDFLDALHTFDLVGFQTTTDRDNYLYAFRRAMGAEWDGTSLEYRGRSQRVGVYPVGIDVEKFLPGEEESGTTDSGRSLRATIGKRALIVGVDRLDYTKGLPQRAFAFEALFRLKPQLKRRVSFVQICSPSRTGVEKYQEQKRIMDSLVGRINGELGEHDWEPIRYLYRSYPQSQLTGFYREARVGLVTPLRDGMNLVAKEYVAAQRPEDPGVLVLSRFAGAAEDLTEAVIVNPYLPEDTAQGIARALEMPLEERRERHATMLAKIEERSIHHWADKFLADLVQ